MRAYLPFLSLLAAVHTAATVKAEPTAVAAPVLDPAPLARVVGVPPSAGSVEAAEDLAILLWLQQARTPEMVSNSWLLLDRSLVRFSRALGIDLSRSAPLITARLESFLKPVDAAMGDLKNRYRRPRPFVSYQQVVPCLPREKGYSFPSGHSTWYRAASELLADLVPERRSRLEAVGSHGGFSRVLCGVHYPSDVNAGQRLGVAAAAQVIASPQWNAFKADPAVRAEVKLLRQVSVQDLPELTR